MRLTEDSSSENLRKFLESDDPALVRMGLSMAKAGSSTGMCSEDETHAPGNLFIEP